MDNLLQAAFFVLGTAALVFVSRQSLLRPRSHGFYRFFAWECILALFLFNARAWFRDPLAWYQLISWTLLVLSLVLVFLGVHQLRQAGSLDAARRDPSLLGMEKTSQLVISGVYRYIRHPMYSSLLFLAWGIFFKSPGWIDGVLALVCTIFLTLTTCIEERENIAYFGEEYTAYIQRSKRFIPFL